MILSYRFTRLIFNRIFIFRNKNFQGTRIDLLVNRENNQIKIYQFKIN